MSKEVFVFEVNKKSFDQAVLLNSHKIPVFVEFMGVWSGPCNAMEHLFSSLAADFAGKFIFAKVDVDEQPDLVEEYKVKNMPSLLIFKEGKLVRTEVGELKEVEARALLKDFDIYHESDLMREQAREKHMAGETGEAIALLTEAIKSDPSNPRVAMDMVQVFIDIAELEQANALYNRLPVSIQETEMGKALNGQLTFSNLASKVEDSETLKNRLKADENDFDARFDLSIRLIAEYNYEEASNNLFEVIKANPEYKEGAAKEMLITMTNMIAPVNSELAQELKRKLANMLSE